jgi:hypothetical protein
MAFDFGTFFFKGQTVGTCQANVKIYNRHLRDLIHHDRAKPSMLVSPPRRTGSYNRARASRRESRARRCSRANSSP